MLNRAGVPSPRPDTEWLMCYVLDCERIDLYLGELSIDEDKEGEFRGYIEKRATRYPLQYITGKANFFGFDFIVNEDVFIPRPETELLVEKVLYIAYNLMPKVQNVKILEMCTGSGCIAISLANLVRNCQIVATDISEPALKVARRNAELHNVRDKITFLQGDLFGALKPLGEVKFDIVAFNPPYIKTTELKDLPPEVRFEPRNALDGGEDGLNIYAKIKRNIESGKNIGTFVCVEKDGLVEL